MFQLFFCFQLGFRFFCHIMRPYLSGPGEAEKVICVICMN